MKLLMHGSTKSETEPNEEICVEGETSSLFNNKWRVYLYSNIVEEVSTDLGYKTKKASSGECVGDKWEFTIGLCLLKQWIMPGKT